MPDPGPCTGLFFLYAPAKPAPRREAVFAFRDAVYVVALPERIRELCDLHRLARCSALEPCPRSLARGVEYRRRNIAVLWWH